MRFLNWRVVIVWRIVEARSGCDNEGFGRNAFRIGCVGAQDAWALTFSCAPQRGKTPLRLAVQNGKDEVAKILREAGALE